jgi:leader peptidase (prepilin peptidase) / N-methyltransferase
MLQVLSYILIGFIGWVAGALTNYLADVLPYRRKLANPFCLVCEARFPVLNYLLLPRECPECGSRRRARAWLVELVSIGAALWLWHTPPDDLGFAASLLLLVYFGVIVVIDLEYRLILHPVSIAGTLIGLGIGTWLHGFTATVLGGVAGFGLMLAFYYLGGLFARFLANRRGLAVGAGEALGFGDVNLSGVLGLILGWPLILPTLFLSVLIGGVVSLVYMLVMLAFRRYRLLMAIPYGPFLVTGAVLLIFFRDSVLARFFP